MVAREVRVKKEDFARPELGRAALADPSPDHGSSEKILFFAPLSARSTIQVSDNDLFNVPSIFTHFGFVWFFVGEYDYVWTVEYKLATFVLPGENQTVFDLFYSSVVDEVLCGSRNVNQDDFALVWKFRDHVVHVVGFA